MTLGALIAAARTLAPDARALVAAASRQDAAVIGVTHDSRAVSAGAVFVAIRGQRHDGTAFAADAIKRGALAIVAESPAPAGVATVWLRTTDARLALAELAATYFGHPSERLTVVGVTGTNGKTTTTYLLASVFDAAGWPCGRLGTVTVRTGPGPRAERDASHTTPEASEVQRLLREMLDAGCRGLRDGSVVARARAAPRRVPALRGGDLHQPDARPPRLPRRHAAVLRGQAAAVRDAARRRAGDRQHGRPARRGAARQRAARR